MPEKYLTLTKEGFFIIIIIFAAHDSALNQLSSRWQ